MVVFGYPVFGFWLPWIGKTYLPLNRDLSIAEDSDGVLAQHSYYYATVLAAEWLGFGCSFYVFDGGRPRYTSTGELVPEEDE